VVPGVVLLCVGAVTAYGLSSVVGTNELLVAIGLGTVVANTVGVPDWSRAGVETHGVWLAAGIVLLGGSLTVGDIVRVGADALVLLAGAVTLTLVGVELVARNADGIGERFGSLLAAGTGICGVSAVVAVGGAVSARETQIAYAAGVVLLMDAITIVVYPIVGATLDLSGPVFGVWAGVSMLSTGPAIAVGFAHSETAGQWATMTKLARNALIGVVALGYASYYTRYQSDTSGSLRLMWANFPKFVLGFLILVALASVGIFSPEQQTSMSNAVNWLFLLAFVGLGTEIRVADLRETGVAPALVVLAVMLTVSVLSLTAATVILG
jgi:Predicted membrane protein